MTTRVLLLLGLTLSASAHALTLRQAQVTLDPRRADGFVMAGGYSGEVGDGDVTVSIDRFVFHVAGTNLKHAGKALRYRAPKGTIGLTSLALFPKQRRFVATGKNLILTGLPNPAAVQIGPSTGGGDCSMVRFRERTKKTRGGLRKRLTAPRSAGACAVATPPQLSPASVVAGVATSITVRGTGGGIDAGSLQLVRLGTNGVISGAPLCTLADAGDGTFACSTTVTEATPGLVPLAIQGTSGGAAVTSASFSLPVVAALADGDVQTVLDVQKAAWSVWTDAATQLGDGLAARMRTLQSMRGKPGVLEAALSPNGLDLAIRYTSGIQGVLMLSPRSTAGTATGAVATSAAPADSANALDRGVTRAITVTPRDPGDSGLCDGPQRRRVKNTNVLVFDPGYFPAVINTPTGSVVGDEAPGIANALSGSCLGLSVTSRTGLLATVDTIRSAGAFGTVVLVTHGAVDSNADVVFLTGEPVSATAAAVFGPDLATGRLIITEVGPPLDNVFAVAPSFIRGIAGGTDHIVYAGHCWSTFNQSEVAAWAAGGATSFFGYTLPVSTTFAAQAGARVFDELTDNFRTTGETLDAIPFLDRIDPLPSTPLPSATLTLETTDKDMAYVGTPKLSPTTASLRNGQTQTYTVTLDGGDGCNLRYHWQGGTGHGHLEGGGMMDDFTNTTPSATYKATGPGDGDDSIRVEVLPPESSSNEDPLDTFCAGATVSSPHTLHVVFDGQGTSSQTIADSPSYHDSASVSWHAVYDVTLPDLNDVGTGSGIVFAGPGTTVTGSSTMDSFSTHCSGPIVVNTSHGVGTPPPQAQTPFLQKLGFAGPADDRTVTIILDAMGGYDYRLCDGQMNIGVGPFAPPLQGYPGYSPAVLFATVSFPLNDFTMMGAHTEAFPVSASENAVSSITPNWTASAAWSGTVTLSTTQ